MDEPRTNGEIDQATAPNDHTAPNDRAAPDERAAADTVEVLREEVARRSAEAEHNWQQFLRAAADLENYRKQAMRQREEAVAATRRMMLTVILGVVDTLERALEHAGGADAGSAASVVEGIRLAHRQVLDTLRGMNVHPMESVGQTFDPRVHEAIDAVAADGTTAPGTVVGEVQRGYTIGKDVLRPARVRVAQ
jgi:molecular chaperone GrpE